MNTLLQSNSEPQQTTTSHNTNHFAMERLLLGCGVVYGAFYAFTNDAVAATMFGTYSAVDQAVSELSATGAASRPFLVAMAPVYAALLIAFGIGVRMAACGVGRLRITGGLLVAFGVLGLLWLPHEPSR